MNLRAYVRDKPVPDLIRETETAYKAQLLGELAQHNKARRFRGRVNAVVVHGKFTSLFGEICLPCGRRLMSKIRKGFTRMTKNLACPFAVGGYESLREPQSRQRLMRNPAAPWMATSWVSKQKSAEGIVP